jgi:hypothetical protein
MWVVVTWRLSLVVVVVIVVTWLAALADEGAVVCKLEEVGEKSQSVRTSNVNKSCD